MTENNERQVLDVSYNDSAMDYYSSCTLDHRKNMSCPETTVRLSVNYKVEGSNRYQYKTFLQDPSMSLTEAIVSIAYVLNYVAARGVRSVVIIPIVHFESYDWNLHHMLIQGINWYLNRYGVGKFDKIFLNAYEDWLGSDVLYDEEIAELPK